MNIITYSETLLKRLGEIEGATPEQHDLARLARAVSQVREVILDLKSFTANYVFPDSAEEIKFFKEIKPVLLSQYLFYKKLFQLRLHDSFNDPRQRTNNYHVVLGKMERFAARNKPFYEYCMAGSTYLDTSYFTRNGQRHPGVEKDDSFSTGFDTKVSKILAHELLKKSVMDSLTSAEQAKNVSTAGLLTWTDSKIALVELVYALHASSAVNSGRGDIKQLIGVFEELFAIDLGNYARVFAELRIRKSGQTNFIDSLKERLMQFISSI